MFSVTRVKSPLTAEELDRLAPRPSLMNESVLSAVRAIISAVAAEGDAALLRYALDFDKADLAATGLRVTEAEMVAARSLISFEYVEAIRYAKSRIEAYHRHEIVESWQIEEDGMMAGELVRPVERAGVYAPGGNARYPSTVLMGVIAARVAGVKEVYVCTPPLASGEIDPHVLFAAETAGATAVFKVGGAGAIAALALGTETVPKVDKIVGPGNIYVTAAKREVIGLVGIDGLAGPSEVVVIADETVPPDFVACDLLAQAEHGSGATAVLITWSDEVASNACRAAVRLLGSSEFSAVMLDRASVGKQVRCLVAEDRSAALQIANQIAAEHVELMISDPDSAIAHIANAGAILVGPYTPAALSDYAAGPNHVLPTGGSARFASPLGVGDFIKRTGILRCDKSAAARLAPTVNTIAQVEGLVAHGLAAMMRAGR